MGVLSGKTAVITGGTRGLGLGIARAYAAEGAAVMVASRSQKAIAEAVSQLTALGAKASGMVVDVANLSQVEALADQTIKTLGRLDIWVNNAGTAGPYGPTVDFAPDAFYQVVQTNIIGVYNGSRVAMKHFVAQQSGKLINMLGHGYKGPVPWQNAYGSSKSWVLSFTMALAKETAASGVGVYAFSPGMVLTDLLTDVEVISGSEKRLNQFPMIVAMLAKPPDVPARKAVWIASSETDGKTGLLVTESSSWWYASRMMMMGLRSLLKLPINRADVHLKTIPPYQG